MSVLYFLPYQRKGHLSTHEKFINLAITKKKQMYEQIEHCVFLYWSQV